MLVHVTQIATSADDCRFIFLFIYKNILYSVLVSPCDPCEPTFFLCLLYNFHSPFPVFSTCQNVAADRGADAT